MHFGETTEEALIREWKEETGLDVQIEELLWTEESFWEWNGKNWQGIVFYYRVALAGEFPDFEEEFVPQKDNPEVVWGWVSREKLTHRTLYPEFALSQLEAGCEAPVHFVTGKA